jgi:uracil-DNA glycosylase family 4
MPFVSLFDTENEEPAKPRSRRSPGGSTPKKKKVDEERGCDYCKLGATEGIRKIIGKVEGKEILVFAQSPGPEENDAGKELVGPSGRWWWKELARVGVTREDCDVQNAVRCFPAKWIKGSYDSYLKMVNPDPADIRCCSLHTERMLEKSKAKYILVLGQVAAKALLHTKSLPQQKIFPSEELGARVYLLDHPSFFIRGYASPDRLRAFRDMLDTFAADRQKDDKQLLDQFGFIKAQDYRLVLNEGEALRAKKILEKYRAKGRRIAVDEEDAPDGDGGRKVICTGFSPRPGLSLVFVFSHKDQDEQDGREVQAVAKSILEDPTYKFAMHYGCSDTSKLAQYADIHVSHDSFDHDTLLSEYLRFSDRKMYGLDAVGEARFPEFSGYKLVVVDEMLKGADTEVPAAVLRANRDVKYKWIDKHGEFDVSSLSLDTLRLYNGADCDLTKRIEVSNKNEVPQALLRIYIDMSYVLYKMEPNGPWFDYEQNAKLAIVYPHRAEKQLQRLRKALGNDKYNPGSPQQVFNAIYGPKEQGGLELEYPFEGKAETRKQTLLMLAQENKFCQWQIDWRTASKATSTYIESYLESANTWEGRLRTTWWLTGTRTGRLSSGGGKQSKTKGLVNLQNIHGDPQIQNQCVSDPRWKKAYSVVWAFLKRNPTVVAYFEQEEQWEKDLKEWKKKEEGKAPPKPEKSEDVARRLKLIFSQIEDWFRKYMPDLKVYLILDYGQIEVRVAAQLSGDENLKKDCQSADIHTTVGVTMTGWPAEKIKKDKKTRTYTKNVHFGILFGSGEKGTYQFVVSHTPPGELTMTMEQVSAARGKYFARYTKIQPFIDNQREFGREHKYVETLFGMKQPLNVRDEDEEDSGVEDSEDEGGRGSWWGNQAINGPVQGTAHQLLECGLVNIVRKPEKYAILGIPVLDVHDALYTAVDIVNLKEGYKLLRYLMEKESLETVKTDFPDIQWDVPIITEGEAGMSLGCKVPLTDDFSIGEFLVNWCRRRRHQIIALNREISEIQSESVS